MVGKFHDVGADLLAILHTPTWASFPKETSGRACTAATHESVSIQHGSGVREGKSRKGKVEGRSHCHPPLAILGLGLCLRRISV